MRRNVGEHHGHTLKLGYESIAELLKMHAHLPAEEIKAAILAHAQSWSPVLDDDVTIVVAKRLT